MLLIHSPSAVSAAILVILKELENACESAFTAMSRLAWANLNLVSGNSPYVDDLMQAIEHVVDIVKPLIDQKKYLRNLFDKAAGLVFAKFTNALVRSRPLKEIGAEQVRYDNHQLQFGVVDGVSFSCSSTWGCSKRVCCECLVRRTSRLSTLSEVLEGACADPIPATLALSPRIPRGWKLYSK